MRKTTDYGLVVLVHYARHVEVAVHTARSVAEATGIPHPTVAKVLKQLGQSGLLESSRGLCGGYRLTRQPSQIRAVEIIEALEGPIAVTECSLPSDVQCDDVDTCHLSGHWPPINHAIREALADVTLADLARPRRIASAAK